MTLHRLLAAGLFFLATAAIGPVAAQTLRIGLAEDPDLLDPTMARTYVGRIVFSSLCDKLVDISPELDIVPHDGGFSPTLEKLVAAFSGSMEVADRAGVDIIRTTTTAV